MLVVPMAVGGFESHFGPFPSRASEAGFVVFLAMFALLWAATEVYSFISDVLREPGTLPSGLDDGDLFLLMFPANALLWATLITVAFVLVRRLRHRRAVSREG